jgi:hypothetical protein
VAEHQSRPTGLVACAQPLAGLAVEVFVEEHEVAPVRVVRETRIIPVAGTTA